MIVYLLAFTPFVGNMMVTAGAWEAFSFIAILALVATASALVAFNHLIKITNILFASSVTYLIPVVALIWGILDGETFNPSFLVWIVMILGGVFLVNKKTKAG